MTSTTERPDRPQGASTILGMGAAAGMVAFGLAVAALVVSTGSDGSTTATGGGTPVASTVHVELSEFAITPDAITVPVDGTLHVENAGTIAHNLTIQDEDLATPDLQAGDSADLSVSGLAPGDYTVVCMLPGHADSGMRAELTVTAGSTSAAAGDGTSSDTSMPGMDMGDGSGSGDDYTAMVQSMLDTMGSFPAATEGAGNQELAPTEVLADGTKVFDLDASIIDWERAPGDVVQAWAYNGMVPGPVIRIDVGDHVQFRLKNDLPLPTDLHLHGLNIDNRYDGVSPYTQDLVQPGDTFTYEYTADEPAVAMYHPHFMSQLGMPNGMFGAILVGEEPLPLGRTVSGIDIPADVTVAQELPMVLNDSGVIGYSLNGKSFPATAPVVATTGDWILVHYYNEGSQAHPMHLHEFDQIVVAKDGFPLDQPYAADTVMVGPGERYSVLVHLDQAGTWVWHCHILPHVEGDDGMFGMVTAVVVQGPQ